MSAKRNARPVTVFEASASHLRHFRAVKKDTSARYLQPAVGVSALSAMNPAASPKPEQNVVGVGIGEKISNGIATGVLSVKLFVRVKYPDNAIPDADRLPKDLDGLPTDVEQVGTFRRFATSPASPSAMPNPRGRFRPARPGSSIGFQDPQNNFTMAGTFGAVVKKGSKLFVLSNNHVLADENKLPIGSPIFQPGLLDGGKTASDRIAALTTFIPLTTPAPNKVDCAIAEAASANIVSKDILFIGPPNGTAAAAIDMQVHKFGRTTGYRVGRVTSIETDVTVGYEMGNLQFTNQILIVGRSSQAFSAAGDSGSLILERGTNHAVALLFAGSTTHTIANHIEDVLQALGVTLA
ncbi:MAG TPA: hypothetical protein VN380_26055 [Thermoanaerobaculia bacterium]|nr:hypothetical protein [Thermoanaerobaculia bacterium]